MFVQNLTEEQRLAKARIAIMGKDRYAPLAGILMIGTSEITDDPSCGTAYTNGRDEKYSREFVKKLNDPELRFLVLHEVEHKYRRHLYIYKHLHSKHPTISNIAMDHVINNNLVDENDDGFATMTGELLNGCCDVKYRGMSEVEVFNAIYEENEGDGRGRGDGEGDGDGGNGSGNGKPLDDHDWDGAQELDPEEKRQLERDIDEAIRQGALVAGKSGSGGSRDLEELLQPQVDWREVLREFINDTCRGNEFSTYRRPNRRYLQDDLYMPSGEAEKIGELIVAIDTSGSIGMRQLSAFLTEVVHICDTVKPSGIRLLYWDTEICRDEYYDEDSTGKLVTSTKPEGGGGTDVRCIPQHLQDNGINAQACIILTDGYLFGGWGSWSLPTLWCILDNKNATSDVGKTVHIKSEAM